MLLQMRFPDGYYWTYPDFPSYVVPYGETSDFFFSGFRFYLNVDLNFCRTLWIFNYMCFGVVFDWEKDFFYNNNCN